MIDVFKKEVSRIESVDFTKIDEKFKREYWGKLLVDQYGVLYCSEDGTSVNYLFCTFQGASHDESFDAAQFHRFICELNSGTPKSDESTSSNSVDKVIQLKASGFNIDEIVRLKKEGVL